MKVLTVLIFVIVKKIIIRPVVIDSCNGTKNCHLHVLILKFPDLFEGINYETLFYKVCHITKHVWSSYFIVETRSNKNFTSIHSDI